MQGTLNEIDIRSILQLIELGQRTGELLVEAYHPPNVYLSGDTSNKKKPTLSSNLQEPWKEREELGQTASSDSYQPTSASDHLEPEAKRGGFFSSWFVFFLNGQIVYAAPGNASSARLSDYLRRYKANTALEQLEISSVASTHAPEYGYLWTLLEHNVLTPAQGRTILKNMVHETLFDLLSLHNGYFIFEISLALAPQLTSLEIAPLVTKIMTQVQEWKQFHPHIQSPDHCPLITDEDYLRNALPEHIFKTLAHWSDGKNSLRQIARYLNRDLITVARAVYPYVKQGSIQLLRTTNREKAARKREWTLNKSRKIPSIVCVDDDLTLGKTVESMLHSQGYEVRSIQNPLEALSLLFREKPDLILCDLVMPQLDGYELCGMLRQSTAFRQTPIIMLTGKDGFIDRVKARMVGSTDYLTKPFGASELLMLLEAYIGPGTQKRGNDKLAQNKGNTDTSNSA
ncbi:MAG: response regulator [Coleofasciculaceae cyanobacterium]